jgi:hypothetical protein
MISTYSTNQWINIKNNMDEKLEKGYDININFLYNDFIKFNLNIKSGLSTLIINYDYRNHLNDVSTLFLNNLPYVDILEFNSTTTIDLHYLENKLQNLPITISLIKFNLSKLNKHNIQSGNLNFLFNIKKPFGCKIILNITKDEFIDDINLYIINETDKDEIIELNSEKNKILINYIAITTTAPKITFYKIPYRQYTNFSMEC